MAKGKRDGSMEAQILGAAKKIFIAKGMAGARMQDIADEAGINKALLHYYFNNKEKLFQVIFLEAANKLFPRVNEIFSADLPLFDKIRLFCEEYLTIISENPYLPMFVLNELHRNPSNFLVKIWKDKSRPNPSAFLAQMETEVRKGTIRNIGPLQLLINLLSLTIFPFVAKPMIQQTLGLDEWQFRATMEQRKKEIPEFIINAIRK
ncbi:MAG TPA: TetR/AcrR family transcriptional regulator [Chitinophagaceae bacterium]|nr:TetR/AcrR family transcriptional regulator [Chitinophagaceae bacterium]